MTVEEHIETCILSLFPYFSPDQSPPFPFSKNARGAFCIHSVLGRVAVWERDVLFSLNGERVDAGMVSGGGRNDLGHSIKWG